MINKRNQNHIQMKSLSLILALLLVLSVFGGCGNKETVSTSGSAADSVTDGSASANENEADADAESAEPSGEGTDGDMLFAGGSGSAEDPWKIATAEQLDRIRDDLTGHYILIGDIDLPAMRIGCRSEPSSPGLMLLRMLRFRTPIMHLPAPLTEPGILSPT